MTKRHWFGLFIIVAILTACAPKKPNGGGIVYNKYSTLPTPAAEKWIQTILKHPDITYLYAEDKAMLDGMVQFNKDSLICFDNSPTAVTWPIRQNYRYFAGKHHIKEDDFKAIITDLNNFWESFFFQEDKYLAFYAKVDGKYDKGYFYFKETALGDGKNVGDTLDLSEMPYKLFWMAHDLRFIVRNKIDSHWLEWDAFRAPN